MGLRICKCGKREMVRGENPNPLCLKCRTSNTHIKRTINRKNNNECIRCGSKLLDNNGMVTCEKCRNKHNKRYMELYNKRKELKKTGFINKASLEVEE